LGAKRREKDDYILNVQLSVQPYHGLYQNAFQRNLIITLLHYIIMLLTSSVSITRASGNGVPIYPVRQMSNNISVGITNVRFTEVPSKFINNNIFIKTAFYMGTRHIYDSNFQCQQF